MTKGTLYGLVDVMDICMWWQLLVHKSVSAFEMCHLRQGLTHCLTLSMVCMQSRSNSVIKTGYLFIIYNHYYLCDRNLDPRACLFLVFYNYSFSVLFSNAVSAILWTSHRLPWAFAVSNGCTACSIKTN